MRLGCLSGFTKKRGKTKRVKKENNKRTYQITPSVLAEWQMSEHGSYEDHGSPDANHVYCILTRAKSRLKVEDEIEAAWLVHSAFYQGDTTGLDLELVRTRAAIGRIGQRIAEDYGIMFTGGLWYDESQAPNLALREKKKEGKRQ